MSEIEVRVRVICDECNGEEFVDERDPDGRLLIRRRCLRCENGRVEKWMPLVEAAHRGFRLLERL